MTPEGFHWVNPAQLAMDSALERLACGETFTRAEVSELLALCQAEAPPLARCPAMLMLLALVGLSSPVEVLKASQAAALTFENVSREKAQRRADKHHEEMKGHRSELQTKVKARRQAAVMKALQVMTDQWRKPVPDPLPKGYLPLLQAKLSAAGEMRRPGTKRDAAMWSIATLSADVDQLRNDFESQRTASTSKR